MGDNTSSSGVHDPQGINLSSNGQINGSRQKELLWRHPDPSSTRIFEFLQLVNKKYGLKLNEYEELYQWSIGNIMEFWGEVWAFVGVTASKPYVEVLPLGQKSMLFPRPDFFHGSLFNFAENLVYPAHISIKDNDVAIIESSEAGNVEVSWAELRERVRVCASAMRFHGVKKSDRVAGFLGNHANAVITTLAASSIGAIWTCVSPDTGVTAVLERLIQIEPKILFVDNAVRYNGKIWSSRDKVKDIVAGLATLGEGLEHLVCFDTVKLVEFGLELEMDKPRNWSYEGFAASVTDRSAPLIFEQLPPSHPLYILYSSGTTGAPKCIVHSAAGTLLQHKKEHILHCDIRAQDRVFYFTTTTWMMWHWLVSSLATGATIILYDGSPFHPHGPVSMPKLIEELKITHFGTSAKYLSVLEQKAIFPMSASAETNGKGINLSSLKAIYSTGSPLAPSTFRYVYEAFPKVINLGSITGGTDIISLFGAPCPVLPVIEGEIQCRGLGMAVESWSPEEKSVPDGEEGDLVCVAPFPCQPTTFWGKDGQTKYQAAYFDLFPGVWHHGDFIRIEKGTKGLTMLGRSDGILKPSGVRFGSAEIYNVLLRDFSAEVEDAVCVGRRRETDTDETVVLFLKMTPEYVCDEKLKAAIKATIREALSARHVPGIIDECLEIPITGNGKKVEVAVKQIVCGRDFKVGASVANKDCLEWYREWARSH